MNKPVSRFWRLNRFDKKKKAATLFLAAAFFLVFCRGVHLLPDNMAHAIESAAAGSFWFLLCFGAASYHLLGRGKKPARTTPHRAAETARSPEVSECKPSASDDGYRFIDKIPEYKIRLERWMASEKPYRNKHFRLLDVMQALPLNRSYLSRMFNEAYDETFFSFVMRYRLEESVQLLDTRPDLTVSAIAATCGFSSASVFCRAFQRNMGVTPKQYRDRHGDRMRIPER